MVAQSNKRSRPVSVRFEHDLLDALRQAAEREGLPWQSLLKALVREGLQRRALPGDATLPEEEPLQATSEEEPTPEPDQVEASDDFDSMFAEV
jgi:antitoxin component of RelBE/YafQ-DinJ toxin-antitoxin module